MNINDLILKLDDTNDKREATAIRREIVRMVEEDREKIDFDVLCDVVNDMSLSDLVKITDGSENLYLCKAAYMAIPNKIEDVGCKNIASEKHRRKEKVIRRKAFYGKYKK